MSKDLYHLKLQKRLLKEQLERTTQRLERLGEIVEKKNRDHPISSNAAELTMTHTGMPVAQFRASKSKIKAVPKPKSLSPYELEPVPVTNSNILRIRQQNKINTDAKIEVQQRLKAKEEAARKKKKPDRRLPSISIPESMFPNRYVRGELPCTIEHGTSGKYLSWACPLENLDYEYYLPLFFDGLQCAKDPTCFLARQGIEDMLYAARGFPERIKSAVPLLARPLRNALSKFDTHILLGVLKALQQLITCNDGIGEVLLPYGKQFLGPISLFMDRNRNIGDSIDYGQRRGDDVGEEVITITLSVLLCFTNFILLRYEKCLN